MTESVTESVTEKISDFAQNLVRWGSDSIKILKFWTFRSPICPIGENSDLVSEFKVPIASRLFSHGVRPKYERFRLKKKLAQKPSARTPICLPPPRSELCPLHFFILHILYKLWGRILLELYLSSHINRIPQYSSLLHFKLLESIFTVLTVFTYYHKRLNIEYSRTARWQLVEYFPIILNWNSIDKINTVLMHKKRTQKLILILLGNKIWITVT